VWFVGTQPRRKIFSNDFPRGGYTPDPESEENNCKLFNGGNDNIHGDYLYETGEVLQYRYEVQRRLGRGAFGVCLRCYDHKNKEQVAVKILKNRKKLHT
jgi:serine/threonine protein kinase